MLDLKERARQLKRDIPAVYLALRRPETPTAAKILAALTVGYALSPVDLIPDFIPVLGYLDDVLLLPGMVALTIRLIPTNVMEACRQEGIELWANGRPKRWRYTLPILGVWALILWRILRAFI